MLNQDSNEAVHDHRALGQALRELRNQAGLTQEDLAARAGIGATYLSQLENGHRGVRWHSVTRLLNGIGVNLYQLADAIAEVKERESHPKL
jgi:transcriptional regulator with XRE-family HTH domain